MHIHNFLHEWMTYGHNAALRVNSPHRVVDLAKAAGNRQGKTYGLAHPLASKEAGGSGNKP